MTSLPWPWQSGIRNITLAKCEDQASQRRDAVAPQTFDHELPLLKRVWAMQPVLDHLCSQLSAMDHLLLTALVAALSGRAKLSESDQFPEWRNATPKPRG